MMARNINVPFKGRIQKRKTYHLQIITFGLQSAAGPYSRVKGQRWSRFAGQFGGLAKVDSGFDYAANFSSFACLA